MYIDIDEFYSDGLLNVAKNLFLGQYSDYVRRVSLDQDFELIEFEDAQLELYLEEGWIDVQLDKIPTCLQDKYLVSNVTEYNKLASTLRMLDLNKPPKFLAAKNELERCELFVIAKLIENAILVTFDLNKLTEFQFYTLSGEFLGILTRIRLIRDVFGRFKNYDCLVFAENYIIDKKDIATLKDILNIVDKEDYCFENLPEVLNELEDLTLKPFVEAEEITRLENLHRIKIPKRVLFYRIPFSVWEQHQRTNFYVPEENISEIIY
ncbi:MAG: hypothetical protein HWN66_04355 [Candidatus Helarchaeota archaeon]|nr:hypothetical protein [Candidatus Helarchaeota archaeon]